MIKIRDSSTAGQATGNFFLLVPDLQVSRREERLPLLPSNSGRHFKVIRGTTKKIYFKMMPLTKSGKYLVRRRTIFTVLGYFALLIALLFLVLALLAQQPLCEGLPEGPSMLKDVFCAKDYYIKIVGVGLAVFTIFDVIEAIVCQCLLLRASSSIFRLFIGWLTITAFWVLIYCTIGSVYILLQPDTAWNTSVTITTILSATSLMSMLAVLRFQEELNNSLLPRWKIIPEFPGSDRRFEGKVSVRVRALNLKVKEMEEEKEEEDDTKLSDMKIHCGLPV